MMRYLLDTNIVSDLIRNPQGKVTARIAKMGEEMVCTSIIVAAELRYGVAKRGSARLAAQLESVFRGLEILPFEVPAEIAYADLRSRLEAVGQPIGGNDMLIAAHAISLGYTVVTDNEREFSRIDSLALENWLRRD
jgi:tRNA(fMet)-specific endonuclease VapC